ncbi:hypothetical protein evm_010923 [Chilo suppressalis]|nr:hypothetical protein evm_010923 [Chilo suppressalis]
MQYLFYISIMTVSLWARVSGVYHEETVLKINAPKGLKTDGLFGYSIAYQKKLQRLIVSAPRGNSVGQVFSCKPTNSPCKEIVLDHIKKDSAGFTDMWLGATVATGNDFTVVCAPRFTEEAKPEDIFTKRGTFGRCYVYTASSGNVTQMKILGIKNKGVNLFPYEKYMDSFGWATYVDKHDSIMVGGPAMHTGRAIFYSNVTSYPKMMANPFRVAYNFGYSITSGQFKSTDERKMQYAISSPYGLYGEGMVIFTNGAAHTALRNPREYYPPVGSLFGASLCSAKLRGLNQREALLVGAPLYFQKEMVDVGAVYVYQFDVQYQDVVHHRTILGTADRGRFGSAILNLGDLDGDNKDEIAISAPYEDSGSGAVYIYSAVDILADEPADKVHYLQKIQSKGLSTLGFSMSAFQDNDNGCNELAIGAPASNVVLFYRCLTQVTVHVQKLKVHMNTGKQRNNTHFEFDLCIVIEYPAKPKSINVDLEVKVSITHPTARITSSNVDGSMKYKISTSTMQKSYCNVIKIGMVEEGSYEPVIQYQVTVSQLNPPMGLKTFNPAIAMLSDRSTLTLADTVWVADCANENICEPVLTFGIETSMRNGYVIGSSDSEQISVTVKNAGDPAYTACQGARVRQWPGACRRARSDSGVCSHNQPLRNNTAWNSGAIELETRSLRSDNKVITITVDLYEQCSSDLKTTQTKEITLATDPNGLVTRGMANLDGGNISLSAVEIDETGKQFAHVYTVINVGVTTWVDVKSEIVLETKPYYDGLHVTIDSEAEYKCNDLVQDKNGLYGTACVVSEVKSKQKFDVIISIYVMPQTIDAGMLETQNLNQTSHIRITYGEKQVEHSITSILRKKESVVPLWVIITATLVGLLIMALIAFALYECGFLRRKNREKLEKLKRSVHRQTIRRSMMDRESKRIVHTSVNSQSDEKNLIEETDDSASSDGPSIPTAKDAPATEVTAPTKLNECEKLPQNPPKTTAEIHTENTKSEELPSNVTDSKKIRKELIILGLQKNLGRQYGVKPTKPAAKAMNADDTNDMEIKK